MAAANVCELCGREVAKITKHHLIPRSRHKSKKKREDVEREELHRGIWICWPCHRNIHAVLTEKELASEYNTLEKLTAYPGVKKFIEWVRRQLDHPIRVRSSKAKKERKAHGS
ncbi:MAG TPA: hypothetical protein VNO70_12180 [Blastocatellia bacterium]|nr:hypothetical protein [Blastocatellia bacterium]